LEPTIYFVLQTPTPTDLLITMAKTIVILGASLTGIPIAHYLLKHSAAKVKDLKVIVVSPNTHMYWNLASVRGILPNMMGDDKLFHEIAPAFAKYPSDQYELVTGVAEKVDPETNAVEVRGNDGSARTIHYDEL
jgi:NADH dehydrogenase FAD-containing subunit